MYLNLRGNFLTVEDSRRALCAVMIYSSGTVLISFGIFQPFSNLEGMQLAMTFFMFIAVFLI